MEATADIGGGISSIRDGHFTHDVGYGGHVDKKIADFSHRCHGPPSTVDNTDAVCNYVMIKIKYINA